MKSSPQILLLTSSLLFVALFGIAPNAAAQVERRVTCSQSRSLDATDTSPADEITTLVYNLDLNYSDSPTLQLIVGTVTSTYVNASAEAITTRYSYQTKYEDGQAVGTVRYEVDDDGNLVNPIDWQAELPSLFWRGGYNGDRLVNGWRNVQTLSCEATFVVSAFIVMAPESITITTQATPTDYAIGTDGFPEPWGTGSAPCTTSQMFTAPFNPNPQIATALDFCMAFYSVEVNQATVE